MSSNQFTLSQLLGKDAVDHPMPNQYFLSDPKTKQPAIHKLSGWLKIPETSMEILELEVERDKRLKTKTWFGKNISLFPSIEVPFFIDDGLFLPLENQRIEKKEGQSYWSVMFSPGEVWTQSEDFDVNGDKLSRGYFQFTLVSDFENDTYHGIAGFLFNTEWISHLHFQVVTQTAPNHVWSRYNLWGKLEAKLVLEEFENRKVAAVIDRYEEAQKQRVPVGEWDELKSQFGIGRIQDQLKNEEIVSIGLIHNNKIYIQNCDTYTKEFEQSSNGERKCKGGFKSLGPLPNSDLLPFGIWSLSKSFAGLVGAARLEYLLKDGDTLLKMKIGDLVSELIGHPRYSVATVEDLLNMSSGVGEGSQSEHPLNVFEGYYAGQDLFYEDWYTPTSTEQKLISILDSNSYPWQPGLITRYRDQEYFILSLAFNRLYQKITDSNESFWQHLVKEVYSKIGAGGIQSLMTKEDEPQDEIPILSFGLYMNLQEMYKVALLIQNEGCWFSMDGKSQYLLDSKIIKQSLLRETWVKSNKNFTSTSFDEFGYKTGEYDLPNHSAVYEAERYFRSFWIYFFPKESKDFVPIPYAKGWGANVFIFGNNGNFAFRIGSALRYTPDISHVEEIITNGLMKLSKNSK